MLLVDGHQHHAPSSASACLSAEYRQPADPSPDFPPAASVRPCCTCVHQQQKWGLYTVSDFFVVMITYDGNSDINNLLRITDSTITSVFLAGNNENYLLHCRLYKDTDVFINLLSQSDICCVGPSKMEQAPPSNCRLPRYWQKDSKVISSAANRRYKNVCIHSFIQSFIHSFMFVACQLWDHIPALCWSSTIKSIQPFVALFLRLFPRQTFTGQLDYRIYARHVRSISDTLFESCY